MTIALSPLSVRTDFSVGESSLQLGAMIDQAKAMGYKAMAVTDTMTLSSMPGFFDKAKKAGIKPIAGCVVRVVDDPAARQKDNELNGFRVKVYVRSEQGLRSLFKLLSLGLQPDHFYYHSRVSFQELLEVLVDCTITTGDQNSIWVHPDAAELVGRLRARHQVLAEITAVETPYFDRLNSAAYKYARETDMPLIVTRPVFYLEPEAADSTDVLRAITGNKTTDSIFLPRPYVRNQCFLEGDKLLAEYAKAYSRASGGEKLTKELLLNAEGLVESCAYEFKKMDPCLPKMAENEFRALTLAVAEGWKARFGREVWGHRPSAADLPAYKERLTYELGVIQKMKFSGYFLLVQEIVSWSKEQGILVGPGRGSVGGSLVAYLMGITDIDPMRFGLLFERFINPDRIDLPDADLDFMSGRRHEIIDYLTGKYGAEHVCGIVNYSTLGPASALRDTARVHCLQPFEYACSKQMEKEHGVSLSLSESADAVPDIDKFRTERPIIWHHALNLEGANRSLSQHAAGVVVAGEPIINRGVVSLQPGHPVVQWDKSRVEDFGLIKIDVLGLNTLDVIGATLGYIKERHGKSIDVLDLPLDDEKVLEAFGRGDTVGVFQFEGAGMRKLLRELAEGGRLTFDDICAATALFRPGPLDAGLCDRYVSVKQGKSAPFYEHPAMEECLSDTFGVIVYQEQVMKLTRVLCGFTPGESDGVRKAIGKKDAEKMAEYGEKFVSGAVASGMSEVGAKGLWDTILGFAGYAFNKSHSYEYSLISWVTMWLKCYYPAEFYAGALSVIDKEERQASLIMDAQARKMQVLPPCIQRSTHKIELEGDDKLYAPFQAVKGISEATARAIVELRAIAGGAFTWAEATVVERRRKIDGKFTLVAEPVPAHVVELAPEYQTAKLGRTKLNAKAQEALNKVGAFFKLSGGRPPMHPDRLRDRLELMPGFTVELVKADRSLAAEHLAKVKITALVEQTRTCEGCSLKGSKHPIIRMGDKPKFMLVFDAPTWKEEREGKLLAGDSGEVVAAGLKGVGLKVADGYYTALVKAAKPKDQKMLTNEQINGCSGYLAQEIEILKPPVIIAMGGNAIRYFAPGVKGSPSELAGKAIYRSDLDATVIFGLNPATLFFNPSNVTLIESVFNKLSECLA